MVRPHKYYMESLYIIYANLCFRNFESYNLLFLRKN